MMSTNLLLVVLLCGVALADICPMEHHVVCNEHVAKHKCTCALVTEEASAPEISCNKVINVDDDDGKFPAISVLFTLAEEHDDMDEFPEEEFVDQIASSLRIGKESVVLARVSCLGTENELTVQFGVLKKDVNASDIPYGVEDFVDSKNLAERMNAMGHLHKIADLNVDRIEYVDTLIDIEHDPDNSMLIIEAIATAAVFGALFLLGCCFLCRKKDEPEYNGVSQKA